MKKTVRLLLAMLCLGLLVTACDSGGSGSGLSGTWVHESSGPSPPEGTLTFSFSGNNFTLTEDSSGSPGARIFPQAWYRVEGHPQGWGQRLTASGTFSISDDRIEFISSDGSVQVLNFNRTDNTMDVGRTRFVRG